MRTAYATSSGRNIFSRAFACLVSENEVSVEPGQITLTRIPCWRTSSASDSLKPTTPNLDAQYTARFADPTFPAMEAMLMMCPDLRSIMEGNTYRQVKKVPRKFVSIRVEKS